MNTLLLLTTIFGVSIQGVSNKAFVERSGGRGRFLFLAISCVMGILFFVLTGKNLSFSPEVLPYSIAFGLFYGVCTVFKFLAISCGPLTMTSLVTSYSLMLPTAYGLIFLHDPVSVGFVPGLILLLVSLPLINKKSTDKGVTISWKWVVCVTITFLANGGCSVVQSMQQRDFGGAYKNEFMIIALSLFVLFAVVMSFAKERQDLGFCIKKGWLPAIVCGVANALVNLLTMVLQGRMPVSVLFPLVSSGGLVLTFFLSRFLYKEKLSKTQIIGFILGTLSVVFLNI